MKMIQFIGNNPYRILGVYVGESLAREVSHRNRIAAYAKVGQAVVFEMRGDDLLPGLQRTEEMASNAAQTLSLPADRLRYALFWFADSDAPWAVTLNAAVSALIDGRPLEALSHYETLLQHDSLRTDFMDSVTHGLLHVGREQMASMFMDMLNDYISMQEFGVCDVKKGGGSSLMRSFIVRKVLPEIKEVTESSMDTGNAFNILMADFKMNVGRILPLVHSTADVLGTDDFLYKECAETVARSFYEQGRCIVSCIGKWLWDMPSDDGSKRTSHADETVRIGIRFINDMADYVYESVEALNLEADSCRIIADSNIEFKKECFRQTDYKSLGRNRIWRIIKTLLWLAFLLLLFIYA